MIEGFFSRRGSVKIKLTRLVRLLVSRYCAPRGPRVIELNREPWRTLPPPPFPPEGRGKMTGNRVTGMRTDVNCKCDSRLRSIFPSRPPAISLLIYHRPVIDRKTCSFHLENRTQREGGKFFSRTKFIPFRSLLLLLLLLKIEDYSNSMYRSDATTSSLIPPPPTNPLSKLHDSSLLKV